MSLRVCLIFFVAIFSFGSSQLACQSSDYARLFTDCDPTLTNRSWVSYTANNCVNPTLPPSFYNVPCQCPSGTSRDANANCANCPAGQFNPEGAVFDKTSFKSWNTTQKTSAPASTSTGLVVAPGVQLFCTGTRCSLWTISTDGNSFTSGNNANQNSISTTLQLNVEFYGTNANNSVQFQYKVDAETCSSTVYACDGLTFSIDGVRMLPLATDKNSNIGHQLAYATVLFSNISKGLHTLTWTYSKDSSVTSGVDMASLQSIVLYGASSSCNNANNNIDLNCNVCPAGSFSATPGSVSCTPCDYFQFSAPNSTACQACPPKQYSDRGSASCVPLPSCTVYDYATTRGPCTITAGGRNYTTSSSWLQTSLRNASYLLCDNTAGNLSLPTPATGPCSCEAGFELAGSTAVGCTSCTAGMYNPSGQGPCMSCPNGQLPMADSFHTRFDTPLGVPGSSVASSPFVTMCYGACVNSNQAGWIAGGSYLFSGRNFGNIDNYLTWPNIPLLPGGTVKGSYDLDCTKDVNGIAANPADCFLSFTLQNWNGTIVDTKIYNCTSNYACSKLPYVVTADQSSQGGSFNLTIRFHQAEPEYRHVYEARLYEISALNVAPSSPFSGATRCKSCPLNSIVNNNMCQSCAAGQQRSGDNLTCVACTGQTFSPAAGTSCFPCGNNTVANTGNTDCTGTCGFVGPSGATYDFSSLSANANQPMIYAGSTQSNPFPHIFFVNPCSTVHDNSSCLDANNVSLPYMVCQITNAGTIDGGSHIGYSEVSSGSITMTFNGGQQCGGPTGTVFRQSIITLNCSDSGVGQPTSKYPNQLYERTKCLYEFTWYTIAACPVCTAADFFRMSTMCIPSTPGNSSGTYSIITTRFPSTLALCNDLAFNTPAPQTGLPCYVPTVLDLPATGSIYIVGSTTSGVSFDQTQFVVALANSVGVMPQDITVISANDVDSRLQVGKMISFRIVQRIAAGQDENVLVANIKSVMKIKNSTLGQFNFVHLNYAAVPVPVTITGKVSPGGVAAIVLLMLVLVGALVYLGWKNKLLHQQNYRLLEAGGHAVHSNEVSDDLNDVDGPAANAIPRLNLQNNKGLKLDDDDDDPFDPRDFK